MQKITAIIPTFNEAHNIAAAIESVQWADEIIVVDSFSTDDTVAIAKSMGCKVLQHEYQYSAAQKNWVIPQAAHQWIILLDADERISAALQAEIMHILKQSSPLSAYWIKRKNYFMGRHVKYSGWQGDKVIRLFKRDDCKYEDKHVHAEIICSGEVGYLKQSIEHNTYKDLQHYLFKMDRYATWGAKDRVTKVKRVTLFHLAIKPAARFFIFYFIKLGILDGLQGFIIASFSAYSVFLRSVKLWRIQQGEKL